MSHPDGCGGVPACPECNERAMLDGFRGEQPEPERCPCCGQQLVGERGPELVDLPPGSSVRAVEAD